MTGHGDTVRVKLPTLDDLAPLLLSVLDEDEAMSAFQVLMEGGYRIVSSDALNALEQERDEAVRDLLWERTEHDKARTEWLLMRDRLNGLIETVENAISTTEPPSGYDEPWCNYEGEIEAAPWAWLQTLLSEALERAEKFDEECWEIEASLRREARAKLERERDTLRAALEEIESFPISGYHAGVAQRMAREVLASVRDEQEGGGGE